MLRWFTTAHFASNHSPLREQREVLLAKPGKKPGLSEGAAEEIEAGGARQNEGRDPLTTLLHGTKSSVVETIPEAANIPDRPGIFDEIAESDDFGEQIRTMLDRDNLDRVSDQEKTDTVNALLKEPRNVLLIARKIAERKKEYDDLAGMVSEKLTFIAQHSGGKLRDAELLQALIDEIRTKPDATHERSIQRIAEMLGLDPKVAVSKLSVLLGTETDETESGKADPITVINDVLKSQHKRGGVLHWKKEAKIDEDQLRDVQRAFAAALNEKAAALTEYLDQKLQARANAAVERFERMAKNAAGISNEETMRRYKLTYDGIKRAIALNSGPLSRVLRVSEDDRDNDPQWFDAKYLYHAEGSVKAVEDAEKALRDGGKPLPNDTNAYEGELVMLRSRRYEEEWNERTAYSIGGNIDKLLGQFKERNDRGDAGAKEAYEHLLKMQEVFGAFGHDKRPTLSERTGIRSMPPDKLKEAEEMLRQLEGNPAIFVSLQKNYKNRAFADKNNTAKQRDILKQKRSEVADVLPKYLTHRVCGVMGISQQLHASFTTIDINIAGAAEYEGTKRGSEAFAFAQTEIEALATCAEELKRLYTDPTVVERVGTEAEYRKYDTENSEGIYNYKDQKIYVNLSNCTFDGAVDEELVSDTIEHERGHAVIDILCRRSGAFSILLTKLKERLREDARSKGKNYDDLVKTAGALWKCEGNENDFLDELILQYTDFEKGALENPSQEERDLFALFEERKASSEIPPGKGIDLGRAHARSARRRRGASAGEDDEDDDAPGEGGGDKMGEEGATNYQKKLLDLDAAIKKIEKFFEVYPEYKRSDIEEYLQKIKSAHAKASEAMANNKPEDTFKDGLIAACDGADWLLGEMKAIDVDKLNLTNALPSQKQGWRKLFRNVEWLCLSDIAKLFKESWEDINRMWKRRGEAARASVGRSLFGLIPEKTPYLGQLAREFQGRERTSEQEEVGVWEKRYEKIDSHTLLHEILPQSRNKDQLKAIVNLLTKRGRMDWEDEHFWDVLESLSRYHMPHPACKRDSLLRDEYLQKLCADIWTDMDIFEHWQNENDSQFKSGISHHQAVIDKLSGVKGGLAGDLRLLLENFFKQKNSLPVSKEKEISPHRYEGVLIYAMRNGKMRMEDKFFYLIQGVAHGLLPFDRLAGFYGELGGVLNTFPFIDFFNGKTHADIMRMARRIGYDEKAPTLTPDFRTQDFLMEEVANDEGARWRVQKAISNEPKKIDHEDMPMIMAMIDHQGINEIIATVSGNNRKITLQGQQNIYVGFNSTFQRYAIRAKMHKKGLATFTDSDFRQLAVALTAYTHFDNITTGATESKVDRPVLSFDIIDDSPPVSGSPPYKTRHYRDTANTFIFDLAESLGIQETGGVDRKLYLGRDRKQASDVPVDPKVKGDIFRATGKFVPQLQAAMVQNRDMVIDMLAAMADKQAGLDARTSGFIPENKDYTFDNVKEIYGGH